MALCAALGAAVFVGSNWTTAEGRYALRAPIWNIQKAEPTRSIPHQTEVISIFNCAKDIKFNAASINIIYFALRHSLRGSVCVHAVEYLSQLAARRDWRFRNFE
jgi:hypothetical protein